jgi:hypothetical protein
VSPRQPELKKSSQQRCWEAFLKVHQLTDQDAQDMGLNDPEWSGGDLWLGWAACWKYLEQTVVKEFIER